MNPTFVLLFLRFLSATLLLGFFVLVIWLIYQDMRSTMAVLESQTQPQGSLRLIANGSGSQTINSTYPLLPVTSIGRAMSSTIVLDNNYVSSAHALITRRSGQWWLEDVGSRNGTLLNELPLSEATVVSSGDIITIGDTKLKVEF